MKSKSVAVRERGEREGKRIWQNRETRTHYKMRAHQNCPKSSEKETGIVQRIRSFLKKII